MTDSMKWVNSWFTNPASEQPANARPIVYVAAVEQLFAGVKKREEVLSVHDAFTFLLRGWNPVTAEENPSVVAKPSETDLQNSLFDEQFNDVVKRLMNFEVDPASSLRYAYLAQVGIKLRGSGVDLTSTDYIEEQKTLMLLGVWMLTRQPALKLPRNIELIRACLRLFGNSEHAGILSADIEYITGSNGSRPYQWFLDGAHVAFTTDETSSEAFSDIVYLAQFASLVRAVRVSRNLRIHATRIEDALADEVAKLRELRERHVMSLDVKPRLKIFLDVYGVKPKKRQ